MNYWERWIGDWKRKTAHLSAEAKGIYGELLDHCYATQRPLPREFEDVCRLAGALSESEKRAVQKILKEFFELSEDGYSNARVRAEIAKREAYVAGQRGRAYKRWGRVNEETGEIAPKFEDEPQPKNGATLELDTLPDEWFAFALKERPDIDAKAAFENFKDHYASTGTERVDWEPAWRKWVRGEKKAKHAETPTTQSMLCGACKKPLTGGWTMSPKGPACERCWGDYRKGAWG